MCYCKEKIKNMKTVYKGKLFHVLRDEKTRFEKVIRPPGIRIITETEEGFIMNHEIRKHSGDKRLPYLPGGKVFESVAEWTSLPKGTELMLDICETAKKEAREEQGIEILKFKYLEKVECTNKIEWDLHYIQVLEFKEVEQSLEHDENIERIIIPRNEIRKLIFSRNFKEKQSAFVLLKYLEENPTFTASRK